MPPLNLNIHSFTPPTTTTNRPLSIKLRLPNAVNDSNRPLHPATHLQLSYIYAGDKTHEIFMPRPITSETMELLNQEEGLFEIEVAKAEIPRAKFGIEAEVVLYAWRRENVLGRWSVGEVKGLVG